MKADSIWYVYPMWKHVSWNTVAEKHIEQLKRWFKTQTVDDRAILIMTILTHPLIFMQPYFYPMQVMMNKLHVKFKNAFGVIGVDVADSDRISEYAVKLTDYATALIVPSNFSRQSYVDSGVKRPVHVVPHGVTEEWIEAPPATPTVFKHLAELKAKGNLKLILCYVLHSAYRKGLDLLLEFYQKLTKECGGNVLLVFKSYWGVGYLKDAAKIKVPEDRYLKIDESFHALQHVLEGKVYKGWLTNSEKQELFDICDMYVLTSRGGGFEIPPFEALTRGEVVIGAEGGSWMDWMPNWALVPSAKCNCVFLGNPIHVGRGVEMNVDKAVDKTVEILNNLEEYKVKVREYVNTYVTQNLTWNQIGLQLRNIVLKYA